MTLREALAAAERRLAAAGCDTPRLDARVLLRHVAGKGEAWLVAHDREPLGDLADAYEALLRRRERREPVAYLTGTKEFYSLPFEVGPGVLVPRPETERLVEVCLDALAASAGAARTPVLVDVGTGSGAVAIAVAHEAVRAGGTPHLIALDRSRPALAFAARNARRLLAGSRARVDLLCDDLGRALAPASVDVVASNPPYLAPDEMAAMAPELAFEPRIALDGGGSDGLGVVQDLLREARRVLRPGGTLCCEIGVAQADLAVALARGLGFARAEVLRDLSDRPRVLRCRGDGAPATHVGACR